MASSNEVFAAFKEIINFSRKQYVLLVLDLDSPVFFFSLLSSPLFRFLQHFNDNHLLIVSTNISSLFILPSSCGGYSFRFNGRCFFFFIHSSSLFLHRLNANVQVPEIVFIGPRGHGKSSLVEALLGHPLTSVGEKEYKSRMIVGRRAKKKKKQRVLSA
jgi:hypothetical protein